MRWPWEVSLAMNPMKICIAALVLIGVLAMCGIGASFTRGQDTNNGSPPPWVEALRNGVAKPRALRLDELQQDNPACPVQNPLRVQTNCTYTIAKSDNLLGATRRLSIRLTQGDGASIVLRQTGYVTAKANLTPAEADAELDIFKEKDDSPGTLSIVCNSLSGCAFTLRE
jgi:hypothetical protein